MELQELDLAPEYLWAGTALFAARQLLSEASRKTEGKLSLVLGYSAVIAPWVLALTMGLTKVLPTTTALAIAGMITAKWSSNNGCK